MIVKKLHLKNFRNYTDETVCFDDGTNILCGRNAQGKTNILEAIYLLSCGRSFRTRYDDKLIKFGEQRMSLELEFSDKNRDYTIKLALLSSGKKSITVNSVPIGKLSQLMRYFSTVVFSPEDLELIKGSPQIRRHFIDEAISRLYPNYLKLLISYHKALAEKSTLLKQLKFANASSDPTLSVWNEQLAKAGAEIMRYRSEFIDELCEYSAVLHDEISSENLKILYTPSVDCDIIDSGELYKSYLAKLEQLAPREIATGSALAGIQRDDLRILINDRDSRLFASQGQQRTAALCMRLAETEQLKKSKGEYPVLLLDDIMSELDATRRAYLSEKITDKQVIITCTDTELGSATVFNVENGHLTRRK